MKRKVLIACALVMVLVLSFSLSASAIYNISVPFSNSNFTLISMSYYLDEDGNKVNFGSTTGVWQTSPSTQMQFSVPGCTGIVPAYRFMSGQGNSWNAGEILQLKMTITDLSNSASFEQDPTKYRIVIQSGGTSLNFTASSVSYSGQSSGGYSNITVNFSATQTLQASVPVYGATFQFYLPFYISNINANAPILVDFGNLVLTSTDGLENINTQKIVDAVEGAVVQDFGYTTPEQSTEDKIALGDMADQINEYSANIDEHFDTMLNDVEAGIANVGGTNQFYWDWFSYCPWLMSPIIMFCAMLLIRKIVK